MTTPSNSMVSRVARVLWHDLHAAEIADGKPAPPTEFEDALDRKLMEFCAVSMIKAMREPNSAMMRAFRRDDPSNDDEDSCIVWRAGVDAALAEPDQP